MPKIKLKNILFKTQERICADNVCNSHCPFYSDDATIADDYTFTACLRDARFDNGEMYIELSEQEFPTNREWLESLSDEDLATFYTHGVLIEKYSPCPINIHQIIGSFTSSEQGVKEWLSKPCAYLMEVEEESNEN